MIWPFKKTRNADEDTWRSRVLDAAADAINLQRQVVLLRTPEYPEIQRLLASDNDDNVFEAFELPFYWGFFSECVAESPLSKGNGHEAVKSLMRDRFTINGCTIQEVQRKVVEAEKCANSAFPIFEQLADFGRRAVADPDSVNGSLTGFLALHARKTGI